VKLPGYLVGCLLGVWTTVGVGAVGGSPLTGALTVTAVAGAAFLAGFLLPVRKGPRG
jgi:hypothetical protein